LIRKDDVGYDADGSMIITRHSKMLSQIFCADFVFFAMFGHFVGYDVYQFESNNSWGYDPCDNNKEDHFKQNMDISHSSHRQH